MITCFNWDILFQAKSNNIDQIRYIILKSINCLYSVQGIRCKNSIFKPTISHI